MVDFEPVRMSHAATCRVASTFSATCNAIFRAWNLQFHATALIALQVAREIASCDMAS